MMQSNIPDTEQMTREVTYEVWVVSDGQTKAWSNCGSGLSKGGAQVLVDDWNDEEAYLARQQHREVNRRFLLVRAVTTREVVKERWEET